MANLVHLLEYPLLGGGARYVERTSLELRRRGHDVAVRMPHTAQLGPIRRSLRDAGIAARPLSRAKPGPARSFATGNALADVPHAAVLLHVGDPREGFWPSLALAHLPLVVVVHACRPEPPDVRSAWHDSQRHAVLRRADAIVCVSAAVRHAWRRWLGDDARCVLAPGGVDMPQQRPSTIPTREPLRLVTAGTLHAAVKGQDVLLRALATPANLRLDWTLTCFGEGPDRGALEALGEELGISSRVRFKGVVGDLSRSLHEYDLFAFPSRTEAFGLALLEAMATGLPAIASDLPGIRELAGDAIALVRPGDVDQWSNALCRFLSDPAARVSIARAGWERARSWPWSRTADGLEEAVRLALRHFERRRPA